MVVGAGVVVVVVVVGAGVVVVVVVVGAGVVVVVVVVGAGVVVVVVVVGAGVVVVVVVDVVVVVVVVVVDVVVVSHSPKTCTSHKCKGVPLSGSCNRTYLAVKVHVSSNIEGLGFVNRAHCVVGVDVDPTSSLTPFIRLAQQSCRL